LVRWAVLPVNKPWQVFDPYREVAIVRPAGNGMSQWGTAADGGKAYASEGIGAAGRDAGRSPRA
jgi:hypothetical protein